MDPASNIGTQNKQEDESYAQNNRQSKQNDNLEFLTISKRQIFTDFSNISGLFGQNPIIPDIVKKEEIAGLDHSGIL